MYGLCTHTWCAFVCLCFINALISNYLWMLSRGQTKGAPEFAVFISSYCVAFSKWIITIIILANTAHGCFYYRVITGGWSRSVSSSVTLWLLCWLDSKCACLWFAFQVCTICDWYHVGGSGLTKTRISAWNALIVDSFVCLFEDVICVNLFRTINYVFSRDNNRNNRALQNLYTSNVHTIKNLPMSLHLHFANRQKTTSTSISPSSSHNHLNVVQTALRCENHISTLHLGSRHREISYYAKTSLEVRRRRLTKGHTKLPVTLKARITINSNTTRWF